MDKPVSRIVFGTAIKDMQRGKNCDELLDKIFELGITTFDTARCYMLAERVLGDWILRRGLRDKVVIQAKGAVDGLLGNKRINVRCIRSDLGKSLSALKTDFVDIYMLHRDDERVDVGMLVEALNELHAAGKIGAFGGSNWGHERIEKANEYAYAHNLIPFSVSSPNFGLAEQIRSMWGSGCVAISGPSNKEARDWYKKTQLPVMAYSSLGRGLFSGKAKSDDVRSVSKIMDRPARRGFLSDGNLERLRRVELFAKKHKTTVPQTALSWIFNQGLNVFAIVSVTKPGNMIKNIEALQLKMTKREADYLNLEADSMD